MSEERIITIRINGFTAKLLIPAEQEELYRKAAKILNERIVDYNQKFRLPYSDILSMVAYEMAVEAVSLESQHYIAPLSKMSEIAKLIGQELNNEE